MAASVVPQFEPLPTESDGESGGGFNLGFQTRNSISVGRLKNEIGLDSGFRNHLNLESMLQLVKSQFDKIELPVQPREFTLSHYLMSALASFKLIYNSLEKR